MFTGIVEETGVIRAIRRGGHSSVLSIGAAVVLAAFTLATRLGLTWGAHTMGYVAIAATHTGYKTLIALLLHRKNGLIDGKIALLCLPFGLVGIAGGIWLSRVLTSALLGKLFAGLLVLLAAKDLWGLWQEKKSGGSPSPKR